MAVDPSLVLASRVLGTLVFAVAVVGKLRQREEYVGVVANYRVLPDALVKPVAWSILVAEIFIASSLGTGIAMGVGAAGAVALLALFAIAITINVRRGRTQIECGCFQSGLRQHLSPALLVRNLALMVAMIPGVVAPAATTMEPAQAIDGIGAGIALFVLYLAQGQMLALRDSAAALRMRNT